MAMEKSWPGLYPSGAGWPAKIRRHRMKVRRGRQGENLGYTGGRVKAFG